MALAELALSANILVTWICTDATLQDCEVFQRQIVDPQTCPDAASNVLAIARKFELPDTIITYCTDRAGLEDLPIPAVVREGGK